MFRSSPDVLSSIFRRFQKMTGQAFSPLRIVPPTESNPASPKSGFELNGWAPPFDRHHVDALLFPDDLRIALNRQPAACARVEDFAPSYRRNVLRWVQLAKTAPTQGKRIAQAVEATPRNEKLPRM